VRDHVWMDAEYDAHITGTVCRNYMPFEDGTKGAEDYNFDWAYDDWQNLYAARFWYERSRELYCELLPTKKAPGDDQWRSVHRGDCKLYKKKTNFQTPCPAEFLAES